MGEPIPPVPFVIDPEKWYCCLVSVWNIVGCSDWFIDDGCCLVGWMILEWLAAGHQCVIGHELCPTWVNAPHSLNSVGGPYDTEIDCRLESACSIYY